MNRQCTNWIDYQNIARAQQEDAKVQAYCIATSNPQLEDIPYGTHLNLCNISTGHARPIVPGSLRCQVFDSVHGLSHPSVLTTRKLITAKFIWRGAQKQIGT